MNNIWILTKTLYKQGSRQENQKRKVTSKAAAYIVLGASLIVLGIIMTFTYVILMESGMVDLALSLGLGFPVFLAIIVLMMSIPADLYNAEDNMFLLSLPLSPSAIVFARLSTFFLLQCFPEIAYGTFLVIISGLISGVFGFSAILFLIISMVLCSITLVSLMAGLMMLIIRILPAGISKDTITLVLSLLAIVVPIGFNLFMQTSADQITASVQESGQDGLLSMINAFLFWMIPLLKAVSQGSWLWFGAFIVETAAALGLCMWIAKVFYLPVVTTMSARGSGRKKKEIHFSRSSLSSDFLKLEWANITRTPAFLTNCLIGPLLIGPVIMSVPFFKIPRELGAGMSEMFPFDALTWCGIGVMAGIAYTLFFGNLSLISASALSRRHRSGLNWMKSVPVSARTQLMPAVRLSNIMAMISGFLWSVVVCILVGLPLYLIPIITAVSWLAANPCNLISLWVGCKWPNLDWENEALVVKKGTANLVSMFGEWGLLAVLCLSLIPIFVFHVAVYWMAGLLLLFFAIVNLICAKVIPARLDDMIEQIE